MRNLPALALVALALPLAACSSGKPKGGADGAGRATATPATRQATRCTEHVTNSDLEEVLVNAEAGAKICLAAGDYGKFGGAVKSGMVTVAAEPGARVTMSLVFDGTQNLVLSGMRIEGGLISGDTRDIVIRDSTFTSPTTIDGLANANVVFDHDTFNDMNVTGERHTPARLHFSYNSPTPSGVTIRNSLLAGGDADGIQSGVGVNIIDNEFRDILAHGGPNHTDAIQLTGARGSLVRGNYIHHTQTGIVAYDGLDHARIENNVVDLSQPGAKRPWSIELYSDNGSTVTHNTLQYGSCDYNLRCGLILLDTKRGDATGKGTVVTSNVATDISLQNGSRLVKHSGNLLRTPSAGDLHGVPVFVGGPNPTSYRGFRLARTSPGRRPGSGDATPGITG